MLYVLIIYGWKILKIYFNKIVERVWIRLKKEIIVKCILYLLFLNYYSKILVKLWWSIVNKNIFFVYVIYFLIN